MQQPKEPGISELARVVERNVNTLLHRRKMESEDRSRQERFVDSITSFAGSMSSVYIHLLVFGIWTLWNLGYLGLDPFDKTFIRLATFATIEAIFLTTFVLIGQKRSNLQADKWAELDLQVSLLTEHEVTRLLSLVKEMAKKMNIEDANDKEIEELSKETNPEKVLDKMEEKKNEQN
jgi:uncharacterized membrane protein